MSSNALHSGFNESGLGIGAIGCKRRTKSEHPAGRGVTRISLSSYGESGPVALARIRRRDQRNTQAHIINDNVVIDRDEVCRGRRA